MNASEADEGGVTREERMEVNSMFANARFVLIISMIFLWLLGSSAVALEPDGGGYYHPGVSPDLTDSQRLAIRSEIEKNISRLIFEEKLAPVTAEALAHPVMLGWPLKQLSPPDYGYHGQIGQFVDHNPSFSGYVLDYNCGARSYDTANYNHTGTDFFTWPFSWNNMDKQKIAVVSAAPGTIVYKQDGNYDRNCSFSGASWNAVYILHSDNSILWYGHMKNGSLTSKAIGDTVGRGEYLGIVGSSGNSTGPHLHLELYDSANTLTDPFYGPCNQSIDSSWWESQVPYVDSAINTLMTHSAEPSFPSCPNAEVINDNFNFYPGQPVYYAVYYRDQRAGQTADWTIYRPDNTLYLSWTQTLNNDYLTSWWYWYYYLPSNAPPGIWTFSISYLGKTYNHKFSVQQSGCSNDIIKLEGVSPQYYHSLQKAYDDASSSSDIISIRSVIFADELFFNQNKTLTIRGGFDCNYYQITGNAVMAGVLCISNGAITVDGLTIR